MKCPFCSCVVMAVSTAALFVMENNILRNPTITIYDEDVKHYRCENGHSFFACSNVRAEADCHKRPRRGARV